MKTGNNVRLRKDGRYEARFQKGRSDDGKIIYGYCYGQTYEEAVEKRSFQLQRANLLNSKKMNLLVLGAGEHGYDVLEIANSLRIFNKVSFLDDDLQKENVIGTWNDVAGFVDSYPIAIVAIADESLRQKWTYRLMELGYIIPTLIHPTAFIPDGIEIGIGSIICARVTISVGCKIGEHCIITSGSIVPRKTELPNWAYFEVGQWRHNHKDYEINTVN